MAVTKIPKRTVTVIEPKRSLLVDKEQHRQKRVCAYCRVSTDSEEQLTSYTTQKRVYTEMIASNKDWELVGIYADEGISGTRAKARPEFQRMIKDCHLGKIDLIITKSVSRFARNTVECLEFVRMLKAEGIGVFFEEQNINTLTTDSELYLVIYAGFAQSESESMSKNITWSYRKRFEEGRPVFRYSSMLGYRKGPDGEPEIEPEEAKLVVRIFDMYLAGATPKNISDQFRAEGITVPSKKLTFCPNMIDAILRNEKYCGDCILQKTITVDCISKRRKKNTGEAPMYLVENSHVPIVSKAVFNKAQEELARRNAQKPQSAKTCVTESGKYSAKYALSQVMQCGECGTRYRRLTWTSRGKVRVVWRCVNRLDHGKKYCQDGPTVHEEELHQAIVRAINRFNKEHEATYMALMKATLAQAMGMEGNAEERDFLHRRIDALNRRMIEIVDKSVCQGEEIGVYDNELREISEQIAQLNRQLDALDEGETMTEEGQAKAREMQETIQKRLLHQDEYDDVVVRQMIECIRVYKDKRLEIIFGGGITIEENLLPLQ